MMSLKTTEHTRMRRRPFTVAALALLVTVAGVASQAVADAPVHQEHPARSGKWYQIGKASWYGRRFQGHRTASGEAFDLNMLTCAHRTLPIGSLVRVTNLTNKRSIMVRVNDRGPIPNSKIVDLSWAAARSLGFSKMGSARVRLERVEGAEAALLNWPNLGRPGDDRQAFR